MDYKILSALADSTKRLRESAEGGDTDAIGNELKTRQDIIDGITDTSLPAITAQSRKLISNILSDDKAARAMIKKLCEKNKSDLMDFRKKADGLLHYKLQSVNLLSGQFVDEKR